MLVRRETSKLDPAFKVDIFLSNGDYILNWTEKLQRRTKVRVFRNNTLEEALMTAQQKIEEHEAKLKPGPEF